MFLLFFSVSNPSPTFLLVTPVKPPLFTKVTLVQLSLWSFVGSLSGSVDVCVFLRKICNTTEGHSDRLWTHQTGSQKKVQSSGKTTVAKLQYNIKHRSHKILIIQVIQKHLCTYAHSRNFSNYPRQSRRIERDQRAKADYL